MGTTIGKVVTYREIFPPINSDELANNMRTLSKLSSLYSRLIATKLDRVSDLGKAPPPTKSCDTLITGHVRSFDKSIYPLLQCLRQPNSKGCNCS